MIRILELDFGSSGLVSTLYADAGTFHWSPQAPAEQFAQKVTFFSSDGTRDLLCLDTIPGFGNN